MAFQVIEGGKARRAFGAGLKLFKNKDGTYSVRKTLLGAVFGLIMTLTVIQ